MPDIFRHKTDQRRIEPGRFQCDDGLARDQSAIGRVRVRKRRPFVLDRREQTDGQDVRPVTCLCVLPFPRRLPRLDLLRLLVRCERRQFERQAVARDHLALRRAFGCLDFRHLRRLRLLPRVAAVNQQSAHGDEAEEEHQIPNGRFEKTQKAHGYCGTISFASRSTRGTMTLNVFLMLRLARPPRGVPVMAKNPAVVALGGMMPEASAMDA